MNDDELTERLARVLRQEAATVTAAPDAWERFVARNVPPVRRTASRRVWVGAPAAVVGLAAAVLLVVIAVHPGAARKSSSASLAAGAGTSPPTSLAQPSPGPSAAASSPPAAERPLPMAGSASGSGSAAGGITAIPLGQPPRAVTFVSATTGWLLGAGASIVRTTDGGARWTPVTGPPSASVDHLVFADPSNGWAWGGAELWSTHDGGSTWRRVPVPGPVEDLAASGGRVWLAVAGGGIEGTAVTSDAFGAASAAGAGRLVLTGAAGWSTGGARLVDGVWEAWSPPCGLVAASSPSDLVATCGAAVLVSRDGGLTFSRGPAFPYTGATQVASPTAAEIDVAGSFGVARSTDGGVTWYPVAGGTALTRAADGTVLVTRDGSTWYAP